ncbi:MAG: ATP-dependent sacrificial sulfur transferase LarE [Nitrospiraceae bacterium]|nr:ATP-dependent sacrificial sulfur transferase LarE [Nitrospiraceae bacterium]
MEASALERLIDIIKGLGSAVVAFSGGVDSTFLLKAVKLSGIRALAVTSASPSHPEWDVRAAVDMAAATGVPHRIIRTRELEDPRYSSNTPERCYSCKDELFTALGEIAAHEGFTHVIDGSTADDLMDFRPGLKAARTHGVRSPLMEAGLGKNEIRELSRRLGLPTWDRPSSPCLASRVPYGTPITEARLRKIALSETALRALGLREFRVRDHGDVARVEVAPEEFQFAVKMKDEIVKALRAHFRFVCLDLEGFSSGSLNRVLQKETRPPAENHEQGWPPADGK